MNSKYSMTKCTKTGIKIKNSNNEYNNDPFANVDPFKFHNLNTDKIINNQQDTNNNKLDTLDLNIENYSRSDLYKLFGFNTSIKLNEEYMKEAKNIVLKMHPDKSRLDSKYFIFFKKAFEKLKSIYDFQNTMSKTEQKQSEQFDDDNNRILLNKIFENQKDLKQPYNFNKWFNEQYEKHKVENTTENGYGEWLKSDEDIIFTPQNINKDNMGREIEKRKKQIQSLTEYKGVNNSLFTSSAGGSSLMEYNNNFTSNLLFNNGDIGYTDLRQAYVESVIPVTDEDYNKIQKFTSIDQYKRHRDSTNLTPLSKEEALRELYFQDREKNEESAALAFYYAQQSAKVKQNNDKFWAGLKQLTK